MRRRLISPRRGGVNDLRALANRLRAFGGSILYLLERLRKSIGLLLLVSMIGFQSSTDDRVHTDQVPILVGLVIVG